MTLSILIQKTLNIALWAGKLPADFRISQLRIAINRLKFAWMPIYLFQVDMSIQSLKKGAHAREDRITSRLTRPPLIGFITKGAKCIEIIVSQNLLI
jgi:hypothetical protein